MSRPPFVIVDTTNSPHARLHPVPVSAVRLTDAFWAPRIETNRTVTIPSQYEHCEKTGRINNFRRAAKKIDVPFEGIFFNDSDVYKWLEAAAYALGANPDDAALRKMVDDTIAEVAAAQGTDGYLNTYFQFDKADERWTNLRDMHELYCAGHLFQAAVAHHRATGETSLLNVARRFADNIIEVFGEGKRAGTCGHPEIEMAMVELSRATGDAKYARQAQRFIDLRGANPSAAYGGSPHDHRYLQDHVPFRELGEVTGHAVRALYLAAGAADVTLETGEEALIQALDQQWINLTERRMYVTGGAGSRYEGEAFGTDYELPNDRAYTETCAAIASVMWNYRTLLRTGDARYADLMELALYNAVLPGVSLDQTRYFYQNPLANRGGHRRQEWFGCACCPPNVARLLAQLPGYFYGTEGDAIYVHLYADGEATVGGATVRQRTRYPWDGEIEITVSGDASRLLLRIPAWAEGATVNGVPAVPGAYAAVPLGDGTPIRLSLPLPVTRLESHPRLLSNRASVALRRGPLIYCLEQADNLDADVWDIRLPDAAELASEWRPDLLGGVVVLKGNAMAVPAEGGPLYAKQGTHPAGQPRPVTLTAIPYYAWANREPGAMQVWLAVA